MQPPVSLPRHAFLRDGYPPIVAERYMVEGVTGAHSHEFVEIAVVGGGTGYHVTQRGEQYLTPGDTFIFRPGSWHDFIGCQHLEVFNCFLGPELLQYELAWLRTEPLYNYLLWSGPMSFQHQSILALHQDKAHQEQSFHYLDALRCLSHSENEICKADCIGLLLLFFGQLIHCIAPGEIDHLQGHMHQSVLAALQMIEMEPAYGWTVGELAQRVNLDSSYLIRIFKIHTGLSPMAYLARYRAEQAAILLAQSDLSIAEIGAQIGWPDANYFARRFKTFFGTTASAYRTALRNRYVSN